MNCVQELRDEMVKAVLDKNPYTANPYRSVMASLDGKLTEDELQEVLNTIGNELLWTGDRIVDQDGNEVVVEVRDGKVSKFGGVFTEKSMEMNKYASYMLIGAGNRLEELFGPKIAKWHERAMERSKVYSRTTELIKTGLSDSKTYKSLKASLFLTDDIDREKLSEWTTMAETIARRTYELLDREMPKLEAKINNMELSEAEKEDIGRLFGDTGFGVLNDIPGLLEKIENGEDLQELIDGLKLTDVEKSYARQLKRFYEDRLVNAENIQNDMGDSKVGAAVAMQMMMSNDGKLLKLMRKLMKKYPKEYLELRGLAASNRALVEVINRNRSGTVFGDGSGVVYNGYNGNNIMDVYERVQEFRPVTLEDMRKKEYQHSSWRVIREPKKGQLGVIARNATNSYMEGLGLNNDRFLNGVIVSNELVNKMTDKMSKKDKEKWLVSNNIVMDRDNGFIRYTVKLNNDEFTKAGGVKNAAQMLYRTYVHNQGLVETDTVRKMVADSMTYNNDELAKIETMLEFNEQKGVKKKYIKPFINTTMPYKLMKKRYPRVAKMFEPANGVTKYGDMDKKLRYVRIDMSDMVVGYNQELLFKDSQPGLQAAEMLYKQMVQLLKIKLAVNNPKKLLMDSVANTGVLLSVDVPIMDIVKGYKEGPGRLQEISKLEGDLVGLKLELAMNQNSAIKTAKIQEKINKITEELNEYIELKYGFIQSMGTSMMIKEFDTVSGLQLSIDKAIEYMVKDKEGNPTEIHKAVVWWMNAGFSIEDIIDVVTKRAKDKNSGFTKELIDMGNTLRSSKVKGHEDTVKYIGQIIGGPNSEATRQGGRVMVGMDAIMKRILTEFFRDNEIKRYEKEIGRRVNEKEYAKIELKAATQAMDMGIDYRLNLPEQINKASNYGVLMFPSFWMRIQPVIYRLIKYNPINVLSGYAIAWMLGLNNGSIVDSSIPIKMTAEGLVHPLQDVLTTETFILGASAL